MDKFGELMCQFYACYSNIYDLYMYKHETIKNQLIGYYWLIEIWKQSID